MKYNLIILLLILSSLLFSHCKIANGQEDTVSIKEFIDGINRNEIIDGQIKASQGEGIRLFSILQCEFGLPYSGYIIFDSLTSQKTYSRLHAVWLTADSLPHFSISGIRNKNDEIVFMSEKLSPDVNVNEVSEKPSLDHPMIVHNLRMDAPMWNSPNSFKVGVVSLSDYFSIGNIPIEDSITIIGNEEDIRYKGFRFSDNHGWEYEIRTTRWNKGPITKIVVRNIGKKNALNLIQNYIDYLECFPFPFFTTESLGENGSKIYNKGELRVVEAYFQNTTPDYIVTITYENEKDGEKLTFKRFNGYYLENGVQKKTLEFPIISKTYDVRSDELDQNRWESLLKISNKN